MFGSSTRPSVGWFHDASGLAAAALRRIEAKVDELEQKGAKA